MDDDDEFNQRFNEQLKMFNDIDTIVTKAAQENGLIHNSNGITSNVNLLEKNYLSKQNNPIEVETHSSNSNNQNKEKMMIQSKVNDFTIENKNEPNIDTNNYVGFKIANKYNNIGITLLSPEVNNGNINFNSNYRNYKRNTMTIAPMPKQMKKTFSYTDFPNQNMDMFSNTNSKQVNSVTTNNNIQNNENKIFKKFVPQIDKHSLKIAEKLPSFEVRLNKDKEIRKQKKKSIISMKKKDEQQHKGTLQKSNSCSTLNKQALCEDLYLRGLEMIRNQREKRKIAKLKKENSYLKYSFKPSLNINAYPRSSSAAVQKEKKDDIYQRSKKWMKNVNSKIDKKKEKEKTNQLKNCTFKPVINSTYICDIVNNANSSITPHTKGSTYSMMKTKKEVENSKGNNMIYTKFKYPKQKKKEIKTYASTSNNLVNMRDKRKQYGINSFFTNNKEDEEKEIEGKKKRIFPLKHNMNIDIDTNVLVDFEEDAKFFIDDCWNEDDSKSNCYVDDDELDLNDDNENNNNVKTFNLFKYKK